jgi:uncharacterized protein DUF4157
MAECGRVAAEVQSKRRPAQSAAAEMAKSEVPAQGLSGSGAVASLLGASDAEARARAFHSLQRERGNTFLQRLVANGSAVSGDDLGDRIERASAGSGQSLDAGVRGRLEESTGADLAGVRVHDNGEADSLAAAINAVAFTTGRDIFFRSGAYRPNTPQGMRLLAHETTHVLQQATGPVDGTPMANGISVSDPTDTYEREADAQADRVITWLATRSRGPPEDPVGSMAPKSALLGRTRTSIQPCSGDTSCGCSDHANEALGDVPDLMLQREIVCDEETGECRDDSSTDGGSASYGSQWTAGSGANGSSAGSQWTAGPGAAGSSAGSQWTAGPGAAGSSAGSQWTAGPGADGTTGTDNDTTDGGIDVDKWLSDPIGQLERLGEDMGPLMGTGQPESVQDSGGGGDTAEADTPNAADVLGDPSGALERAMNVLQLAISGYGAKESQEGELSSTEQGYVAELHDAVAQLSTLRGSDDASVIATAVGPILGVAHYVEGGASAPPEGTEQADGRPVQRLVAILGIPIALAPIIIAGVVIIAIVAIGQWLLTRSEPRIPPEILNDAAAANAALREALAILGAATAAAVTIEEAWEKTKGSVDEFEKQINDIINEITTKAGKFKAMLILQRCQSLLDKVLDLVKQIRGILSSTPDKNKNVELENLIRAVVEAFDAWISCIQGVDGGGGGEKKAA